MREGLLPAHVQSKQWMETENANKKQSTNLIESIPRQEEQVQVELLRNVSMLSELDKVGGGGVRRGTHSERRVVETEKDRFELSKPKFGP